jgi:hemoglobin
MDKIKYKPKKIDTLVFDSISFTHTDVFTVVDKFYSKIQHDKVLSIPFASVGDWPYHIERLTNFWWIAFGGKSYMFSQYSPIPKHFYAGFNQDFLDRWLELFIETLKENLSEKQQVVWGAMAHRLGRQLIIRNEMFKQAKLQSASTSQQSDGQ